MDITELKTQIEETINNEWEKLANQYQKFDVEEAFSWIKYWGNGGGSLSSETAIKEAIRESNGNTQSLKDAITSDLYYEWGNSAHFFEVIAAMIPECIKKTKILKGK
jgi:hypothetical protein